MTYHATPQQPVHQPEQHAPWWQRPALVVTLVAACAALGLWAYTADQPQTASSQAPADAVQQVLGLGKPTIIEFGANNCASCREMKPVLRSLAQDQRIAVADVDILKERAYISKYQIRLMPTQVFYNAKGEETGRHMGKISAQDILVHLGMAQPTPIENAAAQKAAL